MIRLGLLVAVVTLLSACVTTTTSRFDEQRDLDQSVQTYIQIGYRHFENDNLFQAKQALREALDLDAQAAGAHLGLARVFDAEQELEPADEHFQLAIRYGGGSEANFQYGVFLYNQGYYPAARDQFAEAANDLYYQRRAQSFEFLAISERRLNHNEAAIDAYERALVLDRNRVNAYLALAEMRFDRGEIDAAWTAFNGFADRVAEDQAQYGPYSVWLGIRIAAAAGQAERQAELVTLLQQRFADSEQYQRYLRWREEA